MNNNFKTQFNLDFAGEIRVDLFAGGGGASTGTEIGLNMPVDIAINHDENAISMHKANHPHAQHYISDVYEVDPIVACRGRKVGHLHASPDCTHHSQASGGQPRKKAIMMASSYGLTPEQLATYKAARQDLRRQDVGMAKWEVSFSDGTHSTMLSNDCRDRGSAFLGAVERFGAKVKDVR